MKNKMRTLTPILLGMFLSNAAFAQAVQSLNLNLEKLKTEVQKDAQSGQTTDQIATLDLLAESKRQSEALRALPDFDLNRVEVVLKSGQTSSDAFLVVNSLSVDSQSVEAEPGAESKVTLKNIERRVKTALLKVIGDLTLKSVTVFFGAIQEVAVLGNYATTDASRVGSATAGSDEPIVLVRPPIDVVRPNGAGTSLTNLDPNAPTGSQGPVVLQPNPLGPYGGGQSNGGVYPQPQPQPRQPSWADLNCYNNFCVGDTVANNFGISGTIVRVYPAQGLLEVKFPFQSRTVTRSPGQLRWNHR